jgi:Flavoprotein
VIVILVSFVDPYFRDIIANQIGYLEVVNKQRYSTEGNKMKSIAVGITGASGSVYAQKLLAQLNDCSDVARVDLVITKAGVRVVGEELGVNVAGTAPRVVRVVLRFATRW